MKRFKLPTILESESEPSNTNCIWKKGKDFKEFKNGEWVNAEMFASDEFKSIFGDLVYAMYKFSEPVKFKYLDEKENFGKLETSNMFKLLFSKFFTSFFQYYSWKNINFLCNFFFSKFFCMLY